MNSVNQENQRQSQIDDKSQTNQKQEEKYGLRKRKNRNNASYYMEESQDERKTGKRIGGWFLQEKTTYLQFLKQNADLYEKNKKTFFQKLAKKIRTRNDKEVKKFHMQILSRFGTLKNIIDQYDVTIRLDTKSKSKNQSSKTSQEKSSVLEQHQQQAQQQKKNENIKRQEGFVNEENLEKKQQRIQMINNSVLQKKQNNQLYQSQTYQIQNPYQNLCNGNPQFNFWNSYQPQYQINLNSGIFYNGIWYPQYQGLNWLKQWTP